MPIHTIWVPNGWSVEQVWTVIQRGDKLPHIEEGKWVNVDEKGKVIVPDVE